MGWRGYEMDTGEHGENVERNLIVRYYLNCLLSLITGIFNSYQLEHLCLYTISVHSGENENAAVGFLQVICIITIVLYATWLITALLMPWAIKKVTYATWTLTLPFAMYS